MDEKDILEKLATATLGQYNIEADNGVSLDELARKMGISIYNFQLDDLEDGFIRCDLEKSELFGVKTNKLIGVNASRTPYEKRFIIAHELGHYITEFNEKCFAHRESTHGRGQRENNMDFFAACLLMPKPAFTAAFNKVWTEDTSISDVSAVLSKIFRVSITSVKRRCKELGLPKGENLDGE